MNPNNLVGVLFTVFIVLVGIILYIFRDKVKSFDQEVHEKIRQFVQTHKAQQQEDNDYGFIPSCNFSKAWEVDGKIIGKLDLGSTGETSKEAIDNLKELIKISQEHDQECLKEKKKKDLDRSIG